MNRLIYFIIIIILSAIFGMTNSHLIMQEESNKFPLEVKLKNSITQFNPLANIIRHSENLALRSCQEVFQWDQWNCPTADFMLKRTTNVIDKESAFVKAITVASVIYTSIKNCSANFMDCGCNFNTPVVDESQVNKCLDHIVALEKHFIDTGNSDIQGYTEAHNSRAGRIAVQRALKHECRCSGLTNSCSLEICWMFLGNFSEIAADLRKMYDQGVKVSSDNTGRVKRHIKRGSLVFLEKSPDYCMKNVIQGWQGMRGRQCSRRKDAGSSLQERRSCRKLCRACGLKVKKERVIKESPCKCKFFWCCDVQCDTCSERVNEFYCY
ncbi:protein Wnt-8a [Phlebotomus argentipes]|uniref:protein Wnt-8a n=1 Tax=Phlebotomus argentipes TaxID=94469 RepID=UPI002892B669|nr:protein Wnt-8a [Phlebotomus argentipes]